MIPAVIDTGVEEEVEGPRRNWQTKSRTLSSVLKKRKP